jgi:hypothetical protein
MCDIRKSVEKLKVSAEGRTLGRGKGEGEACRAERGADAECEGSERGEGRTLRRELVDRPSAERFKMVSGEILTASETETVDQPHFGQQHSLKK